MFQKIGRVSLSNSTFQMSKLDFYVNVKLLTHFISCPLDLIFIREIDMFHIILKNLIVISKEIAHCEHPHCRFPHISLMRVRKSGNRPSWQIHTNLSLVYKKIRISSERIRVSTIVK